MITQRAYFLDLMNENVWAFFFPVTHLWEQTSKNTWFYKFVTLFSFQFSLISLAVLFHCESLVYNKHRYILFKATVKKQMKEKRDYLHQDFSLDNKTINTKKVNNTQLTISNTTKIILRKLVKLSQSSNK